MIRILQLFRPQIPTTPRAALRLGIKRAVLTTPFAIPFAAVELWASVAVTL